MQIRLQIILKGNMTPRENSLKEVIHCWGRKLKEYSLKIENVQNKWKTNGSMSVTGLKEISWIKWELHREKSNENEH